METFTAVCKDNRSIIEGSLEAICKALGVDIDIDTVPSEPGWVYVITDCRGVSWYVRKEKGR